MTDNTICVDPDGLIELAKTEINLRMGILTLQDMTYQKGYTTEELDRLIAIVNELRVLRSTIIQRRMQMEKTIANKSRVSG